MTSCILGIVLMGTGNSGKNITDGNRGKIPKYEKQNNMEKNKLLKGRNGHRSIEKVMKHRSIEKVMKPSLKTHKSFKS